MQRVLFVVSAADQWTLADGSTHPTGFWAEELAEPHRIFSEAGWETAIATPGGATPSIDHASLSKDVLDEKNREAIGGYLDSIREQLESPRALEDVNESDYDVVFYPGGHGPMEDLSSDKTSGALLAARVAAGRPVALLCHAPAAMLAATTDAGENAFAGRSVTAFSNTEERLAGLADNAKWLLEDKLHEIGANYSAADEPWAPHVVVDGAIYTGQNPASSQPLARKILETLTAKTTA